jgi:hypothetical protein
MSQTELSMTKPGSTPLAMLWTGRVVSGLVVVMLTMSGVMKFSGLPDIAKGMEKAGWQETLIIPLGITELICVVLYAVPRTSVLGAILLTGYMGGAIATHVRIGEPFIVQAGIGVAIWVGLFLRDARIRQLIPLWR